MRLKDALITDREYTLELQEADRTFRGYLVKELVERDLELMTLTEIYQKASEALFEEFMLLSDNELKLRFNDAFRGVYNDEL
jgi:hypothetical protein